MSSTAQINAKGFADSLLETYSEELGPVNEVSK
jgi:hypothetical protein